MSLRHNFVLRALQSEVNFADLCRQFNISRKTGYKWVQRYKDGGVRGLDDHTTGPDPRHPIRASADVAIEVLGIRKAHPTWGARKIKAILERQMSRQDVPSASTINRILVRSGCVKPRIKRRRKTSPAKKPTVVAERNNQLWTIDFKGWWRTGQGSRVEPLTVRDAHSRFVLAVRVLPSISTEDVQPVFEELFERFGMPEAILSDNGAPFASRGQSGLTKLSAWWLALGIQVLRSRPGCPQDNGGHERMHRDIKAELQNHPSWSLPEQQAACDLWRKDFNHYRPHQALGQIPPADVYQRSPRAYPGGAPQPEYPLGFETRRVQKPGTVRYLGYQRHVSSALAGWDVGIEPRDGPNFRVWFAGICLGIGHLPWEAPLRPPGPDVPVL
jgi:putative transposase